MTDPNTKEGCVKVGSFANAKEFYEKSGTGMYVEDNMNCFNAANVHQGYLIATILILSMVLLILF